MIVIASLRVPFVAEWQRMAHGESSLAAIDDAAGWQNVLLQHGQLPTLLVLDFMCLGQAQIADAKNTPGAQLHAWRTLTRGVPLVLAGTTFNTSRELAALGAGVAACCDESMTDDEVRKVIGVVTNGGVWVSGATLPALISRLQAGTTARTEEQPVRIADASVAAVTKALDELTERQREVAELIAQGASNKDVARKLDITERTVKAHLTTIYERLKINDRLQLAVLLNRR